jgi:hypothetical protein
MEIVTIMPWHGSTRKNTSVTNFGHHGLPNSNKKDFFPLLESWFHFLDFNFKEKIEGVYCTTYVTMKKTSVAVLCTISTKSKVGTEFMKPFWNWSSPAPCKEEGTVSNCFGYLRLKQKRENKLSDTATICLPLCSSPFHIPPARELPLVLQHFEFERVHG